MNKKSIMDIDLARIGDSLVLAASNHVGRAVGITIHLHDNETGDVACTTNMAHETYVDFIGFLAQSHEDGTMTRAEEPEGGETKH